MKRLLLALSFAVSAAAQIAVVPITSAYNLQVLPGSTRQIAVQISNGSTTPCGPGTTPSCAGTVLWQITASSGGATGTFTDPTQTAVSALTGLPTVQLNIGSTAGTCTVTGSGPYTVSATATLTVQATSTDDDAKSGSFTVDVCAKQTAVYVAPGYQQAYQSQEMTLQSWVFGDTDQTGTWSIEGQPAGGNGVLVDTGNRDTLFSATVTGRYTIQYVSHSDPTKNATAIVYVSPNAIPSYASTPNGTRPHECYVDPALTGGDYEVGPGKVYTTIQSTPAANTLAAGSIIRVWNTDTTGLSPTTYPEYYQVASTNGTPTQPIILCGHSDSLGNLPIIDGSGATTQSGTTTNLSGGAGLGLITVAATGYGRGNPYQGYGAGSAGPYYVSITGLHIRNATPNFNYTPPGGGSPVAYSVGAACIQVRTGAEVDISGNEADTCTNGIATYENGNSLLWGGVSQLVTIMGNHLTGSGWTDYQEHQMYLQSFWLLDEGNLIDHMLSTSSGADIKDRSVAAIHRYNYLGSDSGSTGPLRLFDGVDVQDASSYLGFEQYFAGTYATELTHGGAAGANVIAALQEGSQQTYFYGSLVFNASGQAQDVLHYANDHDNGFADKQGIFYAYNNTVQQANVTFDTSTMAGYQPVYQPRVDYRNNILWQSGSNIAINSIESFIGLATTNLLHGRNVEDGAISASSNSFSSATAAFTSGDVGANVIVVGAGAGAGLLATTVASFVNSTTVTLADSASTGVSGAQASIGTFSIFTPITGGSFTGDTANGWSAGCDTGGSKPTCPWPLTNPINPHQYGLISANYLATTTQPFDSVTMIPPGGSAAIGAGTPLSGVLATMPVRRNYNVATNALTPRTSPLTIGAEDPSGTPTAATPTFSPAAGPVANPTTVTTSTSTGACSAYLFTGTTNPPTVNTNTYSVTSAVTVYSYVHGCPGYLDSAIGSAAYTITTPSGGITVGGSVTISGSVTIQ